MEVTIWKVKQLDGLVCVYDTIERYMKATKKLHETRSNLFLSVNYTFKKENLESYFKNSNLRTNTLPKFVKRVCESLNIKGDGSRD